MQEMTRSQLSHPLNIKHSTQILREGIYCSKTQTAANVEKFLMV